MSASDEVTAIAVYSPIPRLLLGESPLHRPSDNTLHFIDIFAKTLHIVVISPSGYHSARTIKYEHEVCAIRFTTSEGKYLAVMRHALGLLDETDGSIEIIHAMGDEFAGCVFNDAEVDAKGRLWLGACDTATFSGNCPVDHKPRGALYRYDAPTNTLTLAHESGLCLGNGIVFSSDNRSMWLNDTVGKKTLVYDFDIDGGSVSNMHVLKVWPLVEGLQGIWGPDGMSIDAEDNLYIPVFLNSEIIKISGATGEILTQFKTGAKSPTDVLILHDGTVVFTSASLGTPEGTNDGALWTLEAAGKVKGQGRRLVTL